MVIKINDKMISSYLMLLRKITQRKKKQNNLLCQLSHSL